MKKNKRLGCSNSRTREGSPGHHGPKDVIEGWQSRSSKKCVEAEQPGLQSCVAADSRDSDVRGSSEGGGVSEAGQHPTFCLKQEGNALSMQGVQHVALSHQETDQCAVGYLEINFKTKHTYAVLKESKDLY